MIHSEIINENTRKAYYLTGDSIGELVRHEDGFWFFCPVYKPMGWSQTILRAIAVHLSSLNRGKSRKK